MQGQSRRRRRLDQDAGEWILASASGEGSGSDRIRMAMSGSGQILVVAAPLASREGPPVLRKTARRRPICTLLHAQTPQYAEMGKISVDSLKPSCIVEEDLVSLSLFKSAPCGGLQPCVVASCPNATQPPGAACDSCYNCEGRLICWKEKNRHLIRCGCMFFHKLLTMVDLKTKWCFPVNFTTEEYPLA